MRCRSSRCLAWYHSKRPTEDVSNHGNSRVKPVPYLGPEGHNDHVSHSSSQKLAAYFRCVVILHWLCSFAKNVGLAFVHNQTIDVLVKIVGKGLSWCRVDYDLSEVSSWYRTMNVSKSHVLTYLPCWLASLMLCATCRVRKVTAKAQNVEQSHLD